jgi:hypothetical protein
MSVAQAQHQVQPVEELAIGAIRKVEKHVEILWSVAILAAYKP